MENTTTTGGTNMLVTIFGPNLSSQAQQKGDMHVHAADCADCKHYGPGRKFGGEDKGWTIDATSCKSIVLDIYPPDEFDYDEENWGDYDDLYTAPCIKIARSDGYPITPAR
jgi:hypothetical protein